MGIAGNAYANHFSPTDGGPPNLFMVYFNANDGGVLGGATGNPWNVDGGPYLAPGSTDQAGTIIATINQYPGGAGTANLPAFCLEPGNHVGLSYTCIFEASGRYSQADRTKAQWFVDGGDWDAGVTLPDFCYTSTTGAYIGTGYPLYTWDYNCWGAN